MTCTVRGYPSLQNYKDEPEFGAKILAKYGLRSLYMQLKTIFWLPYEIWSKF